MRGTPMGNPRKPTALRILQGNPGKRALPKNEPHPPAGAEPPKWMGKKTRVVWDALAPRLLELGVLTEVDAEPLAILCTLLVEFRVQARRGQPSSRLAAECRAYFGRFGMTPSDRSRVSVEPKKPESKLGRFGA
jgi:hypothetical protein